MRVERWIQMQKPGFLEDSLCQTGIFSRPSLNLPVPSQVIKINVKTVNGDMRMSKNLERIRGVRSWSLSNSVCFKYKILPL